MEKNSSEVTFLNDAEFQQFISLTKDYLNIASLCGITPLVENLLQFVNTQMGSDGRVGCVSARVELQPEQVLQLQQTQLHRIRNHVQAHALQEPLEGPIQFIQHPPQQQQQQGTELQGCASEQVSVNTQSVPQQEQLIHQQSAVHAQIMDRAESSQGQQCPDQEGESLDWSDIANILLNVETMREYIDETVETMTNVSTLVSEGENSIVGDLTWLENNDDVEKELAKIESEAPQEIQQPSKGEPSVTGPVLSDISELEMTREDQPGPSRIKKITNIRRGSHRKYDRDCPEEKITQRSPKENSETYKASTSGVIKKKRKDLNRMKPFIIENILIEPAHKVGNKKSSTTETSRATNERFLSFVIEAILKEPVENVKRARLMYQRQGYVSMEPCHSGAAALNDAIRIEHSAQEERERVGVVNSHDPLRFGNRYPLCQCIPQFASGDKITEHLYDENKATTVGLQAASLLSRGDELLVEDATHTGHKLAERESVNHFERNAVSRVLEANATHLMWRELLMGKTGGSNAKNQFNNDQFAEAMPIAQYATLRNEISEKSTKCVNHLKPYK
ncbi:hypothetical protein QAD02_002855 [Eretmocerus hayati]|uniref:Uncharacterized protein n=1 Tax=Eretmocerus hayati TaxID=131215 RepID=A0ACC2NL20_9HYME|nr:hypothetical protein QAD02_002855 [Eretmocerus hayati]